MKSDINETLTVYDEMIGKTFKSVISENDKDELVFTEADGTKHVFYHDTDCCEEVTIDDIVGRLDDLILSPILMAECVSSNVTTENCSETWTFYKFATAKGYVTVRWYGESNGYYSEKVDYRIEKPEGK